MKKILLPFALVVCFGFSGCKAWKEAFATGESDRVYQWDNSFKRSKGLSTGIDPQAQEIETRLGY